MSHLSHQQMVEFIEEPGDWPYWPCLPMKRPLSYDKNEPHLGFITADFPHILLKMKPTPMGILAQLRFELDDEKLAELGIFDPRTRVPESDRHLYEEVIIKRYFDVHAMLDDGWVID